ncbi:hypothetical protein [Changpingibacter yushuensis]|uniref:hypothetical protein n=1 Tax=Changpingibacter yushuensis TaxID=2758440 RepID=UPI0015F3D12D|nr:hypothetical protein [Changpingibacter yushuensis]
MKRLLAILICSALLLSGCSDHSEPESAQSSSSTGIRESDGTAPTAPDSDLAFDSLDDQDLLQYVEDTVYASAIEGLSSDDYKVEQVVATYVSKDYLEELNYNTQENIYFGYKLSEIEAQYEGTKYVFALNAAGETEVRPFEAYDGTYDQVLKDVAIGTGVILVVVTVSVIAGTIAAPTGATVSTLFMASAVTGTKFALSSAALGGAASGIVEGFETRDTEAALKAAALGASEGFKWGAITGVVAGGATKVLGISRPGKQIIRTPTESEEYAHKKYGGVTQKSYLAGKEVSYGTPGSTRIDIEGNLNGVPDAIEVKNWDLKNNLKQLSVELKRQVSQRTIDLPAGETQRIALDVGGRNYSRKFLKEVKDFLVSELDPIYPNIPIDFLR